MRSRAIVFCVALLPTALALASPGPSVPDVDLSTVELRPPRPQVKPPTREQPDVIYVPTPQNVVDEMLKLAAVQRKDVVYDLGCGDGRIVVSAARTYGAYGFGFEIDKKLVKLSQDNARKAKVEHLVEFLHADVFTLDLQDADVVALYLLPTLNVKLVPQLQKMKRGSRIVSHNFDIQGYKPKKQVMVMGGNGSRHNLYLWTVPLEKAR